MSLPFFHTHQVQFYETDLMRIVHHSNYLRFCEEARVSWAREHGLIDYQKLESPAHFAVLETQVKHLKPSYFGDRIKIEVQGKSFGVRVIFQYRLIVPERNQELVALVKTVHVPLDQNLKLIRPTQEMKKVFAKEGTQWTETWL